MGTLSVIVVSRHRPMALQRCLKGLRQQLGLPLEVVVVADPMAAKAVHADDLKVLVFDEANISAARNLGLEAAAGDIVAFIDDDAVPEPTWAARLLAAFEEEDVVAATGYVRGRNGISLQWGALAVDALGQDHPLTVPDQGISFPYPGPGRAIKTQGTNCAFRAEILREIGGFDPNYRFFLDETDVNLRLVGRGRTAIVPLAQVHHGYLSSERRRADRVPLSLYEIGASTAVFLRRHAPNGVEVGRNRLWDEQGRRVEAHRRAGRIGKDEAERLMATLKAGWEDGTGRQLLNPAPISSGNRPFCGLQVTASGSGVVIHGWRWNLPNLKAKAAEEVGAGKIVTLLVFSFGFRRHRLEFTSEGYWYQSGGIWGRSDRTLPVNMVTWYAKRYGELLSEFRRFRPTK